MSKLCKSCGNKAKYQCTNCKQPICGRCRSRRKKTGSNILQGLAANYFQPAGLCKDCRGIVAFEKTVDATLKIIDISKRIRSE